MQAKRRSQLLFGLLVFAFLIRLFPIRLGAHGWDETMYLHHAEALAGYRPWTYSQMNFRPPLFQVFLAGLFSIYHSLVFAHLVVALLSTATIFGTYSLGKRLFSGDVGFLAAIALTFSLNHIRRSHEILVDTWLPGLWILAILLLLYALDSKRSVAAVGSGVVIGLATLTKWTSFSLLGGVGLLVLWYYLINTSSVTEGFKTAVRSRMGWAVLAGFLLAMTPYLVWATSSFGSPFAPIVTALHRTGSPEPFLFYINRISEFIPVTFLVGAALAPWAAYHRTRRWAWGALICCTIGAVLYFPLQFLISNREVRYLLPIAPFVAVLAGVGIIHVVERLDREAVILGGIALLVLSSAPILTNPYVSQLETGHFVTHYTSPEMAASQFIHEHATDSEVVYLNHDQPWVAYYSNQPVHHITGEFDPAKNDEFEHGSWLYYTERRDFSDEELQKLLANPRVTNHHVFGDRVHVFYYR